MALTTHRRTSGGGIPAQAVRPAVETDQDTIVVTADGEIDIETMGPLRQRLLDAMDSAHTCVLLDLSEVTFIDSTGLGLLAGMHKRLRDRGQRFVVVTEQPRVLSTLRITGLNKVLYVESRRPH